MSSIREALRSVSLPVDEAVDLDAALYHLPTPYRKALDLWRNGYSQREASRALGYCNNAHLVERALVELLKELNDETGA